MFLRELPHWMCTRSWRSYRNALHKGIRARRRQRSQGTRVTTKKIRSNNDCIRREHTLMMMLVMLMKWSLRLIIGTWESTVSDPLQNQRSLSTSCMGRSAHRQEKSRPGCCDVSQRWQNQPTSNTSCCFCIQGHQTCFSFMFLGVPRHYVRRTYSCWCKTCSRVRGRGHGSNSCVDILIEWIRIPEVWPLRNWTRHRILMIWRIQWQWSSTLQSCMTPASTSEKWFHYNSSRQCVEVSIRTTWTSNRFMVWVPGST